MSVGNFSKPTPIFWPSFVQKHIIEVSLQEGRRFLYEGHHSMAIPAALEALKFLTEVYGNANIHLTPAYLILGAAAIGLGRLKEADQYLSQVSLYIRSLKYVWKSFQLCYCI